MTAATGCPVHADFDPLSEAFLRDPHAAMNGLPPVFYAPSIDYYVVTRYADIERLVAAPQLIPGAVDEMLRYDPSVPVWRRVTKRPVTLGGVDLPEGAKLFLWLAAAGRDGDMFPEPDRFDPERDNARRTLAFGRGIHFCIGSALGRLEAVLA